MGLTANELSPSKATGGSNPLASAVADLSAAQLNTGARSSTDRASDYGSEGWGFESLRARSQPADMTPPLARDTPVADTLLIHSAATVHRPHTYLAQPVYRSHAYDAADSEPRSSPVSRYSTAA